MNIISYLTYAGGFDIGMQDAGLPVTYHLHDGYAQKTWERNWPANIRTNHWKDRVNIPNVDLLFANPPCACWSVNGKQLGLDDPRAADTLRLFDLAKEYKPKILITESVVPAMKFFEEEFAEKFHWVGYSTKIVLVNAKWHGMIQDRKRMFFIASKVGIDIPAPNWAPPRTCREALGAFPIFGDDKPATRPLERRAFDGQMDQILPGESLAKAWARLVGGPNEEEWERNSRGHVTGRPPFCSYRLHPDKSSRAFTGYYAYVHPLEHRWLTLREIKDCVCEFPEDYMFHEQHIGEMMKEMSRGVMPPVARWLGGHIKQALDMSIACDVDHEVIDYRIAP